jgi:hypothetical protein
MKTVGYSPKAIWTTVFSGALGTVLALLTLFQENPELMGPLPAPVQALILLVLPALGTWITGYYSKPGEVVEDTSANRGI